MAKVLFVYPNKDGYPIIPLAISLLSGILKHDNHIVDLFDITFMMSERSDHNAREKTGLHSTASGHQGDGGQQNNGEDRGLRTARSDWVAED